MHESIKAFDAIFKHLRENCLKFSACLI